MHCADGSDYDGGYRKGRRNGRGTFIASNGMAYSGGWKNGQRNGHGSLSWPNGDRFVGVWDHGAPVGNGTFYSQDHTYVGVLDSNGNFIGNEVENISRYHRLIESHRKHRGGH